MPGFQAKGTTTLHGYPVGISSSTHLIAGGNSRQTDAASVESFNNRRCPSPDRRVLSRLRCSSASPEGRLGRDDHFCRHEDEMHGPVMAEQARYFEGLDFRWRCMML